ncbi:chorismate mutase [Streptomyces gobiensis]|uniref:chorismate mutase n=1 Tax=Streptomyces gobiensis TaxID=2875706 RepID=UPI001E3F7671|nr:chorismate mutase [Streptomyces gobiensis]UGY93857.1 chorismate mutase [Streptomyces gobiensis]
MTPAHGAQPTVADDSAEAELNRLRARLDATDRQVMDVIAQRLCICDEIGEVKRRSGVPMMQPSRIDQVTAAYAEHATERELSGEFGRELARLLIAEACRRETDIIDRPDGPDGPDGPGGTPR